MRNLAAISTRSTNESARILRITLKRCTFIVPSVMRRSNATCLFAEIRMVVCAAPSYLTRRGRPTTPADLRQHDCLVFSETLGPIEWHFQSPKGRISVKVRGRLCANNLDAMVSVAIGGAGIARVPSWQVSADLSAGRLEALLTQYETSRTRARGVPTVKGIVRQSPGVH
jgi:DNA-binding transcriptional LysR family regulator